MGADDTGTSAPMCSQQPWPQTPFTLSQTAIVRSQKMEEGYPYNWPRIIYEDWNRFRSSTINGANGLRTLYTIHGKDIVLKDPRFSPDINCTSDKVWSRNGINQFVNGPVFHGVRLNMSMFDEFLTPKPRPTSAPFQSVPNVIDWEKYFSQRIPWHPAGDQYGSNVWFPGSNVIVYTPPRFEVLMPLVDDPMTFPTMMMPSYQEQLAQFSGIYKWGLDNGFPISSLLAPSPSPPRPPSPFDLIDRIDQLHLSGRLEVGSWNADAFPNSSHVPVESENEADHVSSPEASQTPSVEQAHLLVSQEPAARDSASPPVFNDPTPMLIDHFMGAPQIRNSHRNHDGDRKGSHPPTFRHNHSGSPARRGRGCHHGPQRHPTPPRKALPSVERPNPSLPAPPRPSPPRPTVLVARPASNPQNPVRQAPGRPAPIRQHLPAQPAHHWIPQRPRPRRLEEMKLNEVLGLDGHIRQERRDGARNRNRQPQDNRHHDGNSNANRKKISL